MSSEMRLRKRISPIQMNSGSAVSAQLADDPHTVVAMSLPAGAAGEERHGDPADAEQRERDPDARDEQDTERREQDNRDEKAGPRG